ncbi:3-dehydroquinate synthase [Candidatus Magnetoovum chiemensis]|nr:3-dehydroquinate synthase [Candidatus Magnetoovum chiemensis]
MNIVKVDLVEKSYEIYISSSIINTIGDCLADLGFENKVVLVSNPGIYERYGKIIMSSAKKAGFNISSILVPDGEEYKDFNWAYYILSELIKLGLDKKSALLALGGGVIGDITGFVASTYLRGIGYVQIPTTLLAQVDSSVGGQTGVNHPLGKNMIGTAYQPRLVVIDMDTLHSLPERDFLSGMSEIIKYGIIWDRDFFEFLWNNEQKILTLDDKILGSVIERACQIKAEVVSMNEKEPGLTALLDFGHTIGHAIETLTGYKRYHHGEVVSIGMYVETKLSHILSIIDELEVLEIKDILRMYKLPHKIPSDINIASLISPMRTTATGLIKFALPERIGKAKIIELNDNDKITAAVNAA